MSKKRHFTLIELLIGLSLLAILTTCLFQFFIENKKVEHRLFTTKNELINRTYLNAKLNEIFSHIVPREMIYKNFKNESSLLAENSKSLTVLYNNKIDPSPLYSGPIIAKLFLREDQLILQTIPLEKTVDYREEVLYSSLSSIQFKFFGEKNKKPGWLFSWQNDRYTIPKMISLTLRAKGEKHPVEFIFFLPTIHPPVTYI